MTIDKSIIIDKNIDQVWEILGVQFTEIDRWAATVHHSEGSGQGPNGGACEVRSCETSVGHFQEKLLHFSSEQYTLIYQATDQLPFPIKQAQNCWQLERIDKQRTKVSSKASIDLAGLSAFLMGPMVWYQFSALVKELLEELKYYAERGVPHPRKLKALEQQGLGMSA